MAGSAGEEAELRHDGWWIFLISFYFWNAERNERQRSLLQLTLEKRANGTDKRRPKVWTEGLLSRSAPLVLHLEGANRANGALRSEAWVRFFKIHNPSPIGALCGAVLRDGGPLRNRCAAVWRGFRADRSKTRWPLSGKRRFLLHMVPFSNAPGGIITCMIPCSSLYFPSIEATSNTADHSLVSSQVELAGPTCHLPRQCPHLPARLVYLVSALHARR